MGINWTMNWDRFKDTLYRQWAPFGTSNDGDGEVDLGDIVSNFLDPFGFLPTTGNPTIPANKTVKPTHAPGGDESSGKGSPYSRTNGESKWEETSPPGGKSQSAANAQTNYVDYVKWKRKELENVIARYREAYPKQIAAYKESALAGLNEQKKPMWEGMFTNLDKRGLSDSASFLGGAKTDLEKWMTSEKGTIEDTAQGMETNAQQAILAAIGKPDYAGVYNAWNEIDQRNMEYLTSMIGKTDLSGNALGHTYNTSTGKPIS